MFGSDRFASKHQRDLFKEEEEFERGNPFSLWSRPAKAAHPRQDTHQRVLLVITSVAAAVWQMANGSFSSIDTETGLAG